MEFEIIIAVDNNYGIGYTKPINDRTIGWDISDELQRFKKITSDCPTSQMNAIIMGRKTVDTFNKPLPNRLNVVISSNPSYRSDEGFITFPSLDHALKSLQGKVYKAFVIGGAQLYEEAILNRYCRKLHLTMIDQNYSHDIVLNSLRSSSLLNMNDVTPDHIFGLYKINQTTHKLACKILKKDITVIYSTYVYRNKQES